ncbi:IS1182 family transposase [Emticicia sp. 21SJ11W-3]|uniref:IS1182 family transposase n=1 Tax=Emticicia sp. 21SJ11W-3 TaxID=2916755 RepID=UPI0038D50126
MKIHFKSLPANKLSLFPEDIFSRIPQNHPVRLVNEVVDGLDISMLVSQYKGGGTSSYHPRMLLKVLFYSYLSNIYSCRKIEKALQENIHLMWLSGNSTPDYRTINYFRGKRLKGHIQSLFAAVVRMLHELQYVSLDLQYVDGTKIESASGRYSFVWKGSVEKNKAKLEGKIQSVLSEIESQIKQDQGELNRIETPKPIDSTELKNKLAELNSKQKGSTKQTQKQIKQLQDEHLPRLEKYEQQLETLGDRNSYSKTDEEATFMRLKDDHMQNGQLKPAYNSQISTENQFITHYSIHQTAGDTTTLTHHLEGFQEQYGKQSTEVVADAGYGSEQNYEWLEEKAITAYVKYNYFHKEQKRSQKNNPFLVQNLYYNKALDFYVCPMGQRMVCVGQGKRTSSNGYESGVRYYQAKRCDGCPLRGMCHKSKVNRRIEVNPRLNELKAKARAWLLSEEGLKHRSKRPIEVEAVFGQMKSNNKFSRFTLRGLQKVGIEFGLMAIGHNLRKWAAKRLSEQENQQNSVSTAQNRTIYVLFESYQIKYRYAA